MDDYHQQKEDRFLPLVLRECTGMYRALARSVLWVVPNRGHGPVFMEAARQFAQTALDFLGESSCLGGSDPRVEQPIHPPSF
jgi:hypothetical protein